MGTWAIIGYAMMINSFVFQNPLFECNGERVTEVVACQNMERCVIINDYTAVAYAHLYCERELLREWIQTSAFIGMCIAPFLITLTANKIGRRRAYFLNLLLGLWGIISLLVGIYFSNAILMILGLFFLGTMVSGFNTLTYICSTEYFN